MKVVLYEDEDDFRKVVDEAQALCLERKDRKGKVEVLDAVVFDNTEKFDQWFNNSAEAQLSLAVVDLEIDKKDLEGLRAVDVLSARYAVNKVPIVVFSKVNSPKARQMAYDAGATSYIKKPSTRVKLVRALADIFIYWVGLNERSEKPTAL